MPISRVIRRLVRGYGKTAYRINDGDCEGFAHDLIFLLERLGMNPLYWDTDVMEYPGHSWVIIHGKCYDAEIPSGVSDWKHLPIFEKFLKRFRLSSTAEDKRLLCYIRKKNSKHAAL